MCQLLRYCVSALTLPPLCLIYGDTRASLVVQTEKNPPTMQERPGFDLWVGKILWRRAWQPTPVFLPEESPWAESLEGYSSWGCKELDMPEQLSTAHRIPYSYFSLEVWGWRGPVPPFLHVRARAHTHTHTLPFSSLLMSEPVQERGIVTLSHSILPAISAAVFCILLLTFSNNSG